MDEYASIKSELERLKTRLRQIRHERITQDLFIYEGSVLDDDDTDDHDLDGISFYRGQLRIPYDGVSFSRDQAYVVLYNEERTRCICSPRSIAARMDSISDTDLQKGFTATDGGSDHYSPWSVSLAMKTEPCDDSR